MHYPAGIRYDILIINLPFVRTLRTSNRSLDLDVELWSLNDNSITVLLVCNAQSSLCGTTNKKSPSMCCVVNNFMLTRLVFVELMGKIVC